MSQVWLYPKETASDQSVDIFCCVVDFKYTIK